MSRLSPAPAWSTTHERTASMCGSDAARGLARARVERLEQLGQVAGKGTLVEPA